MSPLEILVATLCLALKAGIPEVAERVFFQVATPRQIKEVPFILLTFEGEQVEPHDSGVPTEKHIPTIGVTVACRGVTESASVGALQLKTQIETLLKEYQFIPNPDDPDAPAIIDEIRLDSVHSIALAGEGDRVYSGIKLLYQAEYLVDVGSCGDAGPGIPESNVLRAFLEARGDWQPRQKSKEIVASDSVVFPEEKHVCHSAQKKSQPSRS